MLLAFGCGLAGAQEWGWNDGSYSRRYPADQADADAREALAGGDYPWYDAESDDLKRVDLPVQADAAPDDHRDSNWTTRPKPPPPPTATPAPSASGFSSVLMGIFWGVLVLIFGGLIFLLIWWFLRREQKQAQAKEPKSSRPGEAARIEQLPFQVMRPRGDLLSEARRHYEAGQYGQAIVYLFSYQLVELDRSQVIRLTKGKTNRQYLGETNRQPGLSPLLEQTMIAFEDVFFGHHSLHRDRFEACWRRLDEFHQLIGRQTA